MKKVELKDYFVTQEQAESLKELGFKDVCLAYYREGELVFNHLVNNNTIAPLIAQALDWLTSELNVPFTSVNDGIVKLRLLRKKVTITVTLTFEVYQASKTYEDGEYLIIKNNDNLFLTGSAGTGKSFTINKIVEYLIDNDIKYGLTALTGCAASLIKGQTLHSYLNLGINKSINEIYNDLSTKYISKQRLLKSLQTLIIDEVSMMSNELLELIDNLFKMIKSLLLSKRQLPIKLATIPYFACSDNSRVALLLNS